MLVPEHMEITASLMAGYRFSDGSLLEVDSAGDYRITDAWGEVIWDTIAHETKASMHPGAMGWADYGEVMDDLAAFLGHDAEMFEFSEEGSWGKRYPNSAKDVDEDELIFNLEVARWADEHSDELSILANYREEGRL